MRKLLLAALTITAIHAQEVIFTESGYRWIRRAVLVPWSDFNLGTATTLTTDFLQSEPEDYLVQFLVVTERWQAEQTPRPTVGGLAKRDWTMAEADAWRSSIFEEWLKVRGSYMKLDWTIAETTAFGGDVVMRFRIGNGRPSRHVLMCRLSWKWRERSPVKITERTNEKATQALHGRREGRHSETPFAGGGAGLEAL